MAVITLRLPGSTAPTATSGVSTTAISLGGAVSTAARPQWIWNGDTGVPLRGDGLTGVIGVCGSPRFESRGMLPFTLVDALRDIFRGVLSDDVERANVDVSRGRPRPAERRLPGVDGSVGVGGTACASSSVHCRCRMTDFVAH